MTSPQMFQNIPISSLPYVKKPTIMQFDKNAPGYQELYKKLFKSNQELALWIYQKAEEIYEDLDEREAAATLALEAIAILANQLTHDSLSVTLYPTTDTNVIQTKPVL